MFLRGDRVCQRAAQQGLGTEKISTILEVQASQREGSSPIPIATVGHGINLTVESQSDRGAAGGRPVVRDKST